MKKLLPWGFLSLVVILLLLPVKLEGFTRPQQALIDWLHVPIFLSLTVIMFLGMRKRVALLLVGAVVVMAEMIQPLIGRSAGWLDLAYGVTGMCCGISAWLFWKDRARKAVGMGMLVVLLGGSLVWPGMIFVDARRMVQQYPLLAGFESYVEMGRWNVESCEWGRSREHVRQGDYSALLRVEDDAEDYPGAFLENVVPDWSRMHALTIDYHLAGETSKELWVRIDDRETQPPYDDRFQLSFPVKPGEGRIQIFRESLVTPAGRMLKLEHITRVGIFFAEAEPGTMIYLDNIKVVLEDKE